MLKIKYEIFRHASYVTDRSFQEMIELHVFKKILHHVNHQFISNLDHYTKFFFLVSFQNITVKTNSFNCTKTVMFEATLCCVDIPTTAYPHKLIV